jgi:hypothetical protein
MRKIQIDRAAVSDNWSNFASHTKLLQEKGANASLGRAIAVSPSPERNMQIGLSMSDS